MSAIDGAAAVTAEAQVARVFAWRRGFNAMHLIDLGLRLGLFRALAEAPAGLSPGALAGRLGLQARHAGVWCTAAYALGILETGEGGALRLAPHLDAIFANPAHPRYLGGYVQLGTDFATEDFRFLRDAFRTGGAVPFQGRGETFARTAGQATQGLQILAARKVLPGLADLPDRLAAGGTVLEVGCGTGSLLLELAKAFPAARVVGLDVDEDSLAVARRRVGEAGLEGRVEARSGSPDDALAPGSADACVMVEVLHEIAPGLRPAVVGSGARALRPGGWMAIVDETYPSTLEEARRPEFQFPIQTALEELAWGNAVPIREEQEALLRGAGLTGAIRREIVGEGFTVLTVRR